jgi:hypothetical protein
MSTMSQPVPFRLLRDLMRHACASLLDAEVRFALMGGFAVWARGGPQPPMTEDVDLAIRARDIDDAANALQRAGFEIVNPDQGWLVKALHDATNRAGERLQVDLIHSPIGLPITDEVLDRATHAYVAGMPVPCLAPIDMMTTKLLVLAPNDLDYTGVVGRARVLREQFDWDELERRAAGNDVALGFFDIARRLRIDPRSAPTDAPSSSIENEPAARVQRLAASHGTTAEDARRRRARDDRFERPATPLSGRRDDVTTR